MSQHVNPYAPPSPPKSAEENNAEKGDGIRWALLVVGTVFLLPVLPNLLKGDVSDALGGLALGVAGVGGFAFLTRFRRRRRRFTEWLAAHRDEVVAGTAKYDGLPVTLSTKVRVFDVAISLLLVSFRFSSAFVLEHDPAAVWARVLATLVTLLLGWWGFPFGPIFTLIVLYRNARGGHTVTVAQMLGVNAPEGGLRAEAPSS